MKTTSLADYTGAINSGLCIIHCLLTPVLVVWLGHQAEHALEWLFLGISLVAVFFTARHTAIPALRAGLWVAFVVFAASILLGHDWPPAEYLAYGASGVLVVLHLINLYHCRAARHCALPAQRRQTEQA